VLVPSMTRRLRSSKGAIFLGAGGREEGGMLWEDFANTSLSSGRPVRKDGFRRSGHQAYPIELINLDSFQVYSHFRIETGRSDLSDLASFIPIYMGLSSLLKCSRRVTTWLTCDK
jgi:hypothetical protein